MGDTQAFRYDGKHALVVGGATGMGAAAAQAVAALGADVTVLDRVPVDYPVGKTIEVDLLDRERIDAALDQVAGPVHAVFCAAGIGGGPGTMRVNIISHRHLVERLIADGRLAAGSAICFISSVAGLGWQNHLPRLVDFLATASYEEADAWVNAHEGTDTYMFSKQAVNAYVARQAYPFTAKGIRINAICPGPTDTPLARANSWGGFDQAYREATGMAPLQPEQMANVMAFLNSAAASGISGESVLVDSGHVKASMGGSWEAGKPVIDFLMTETSV
ncbi:SDR family oxidoreductase [Frankia sp. CNm7]|uniref:SDR family oxidoreductase n=1 Tax=Frankia nepalensis TaxID=1836974 RepID=A0A937R878_9ACTN|nr:SDR family oxidoreductase [Frankia nepalensis]MBL7500016.1 SDR family oxidoreductase [Frankia nepalensis]MBL7510638.1 SDR family oxidoreductase [Frankia nepalensis]MBL7520781.1 SDR family oxidoreductase [Frankia nepalensis]MBL7627171.1 SDR family oxidoreductase [Frankia nepalensis]